MRVCIWVWGFFCCFFVLWFVGVCLWCVCAGGVGFGFPRTPPVVFGGPPTFELSSLVAVPSGLWVMLPFRVGASFVGPSDGFTRWLVVPQVVL